MSVTAKWRVWRANVDYAWPTRNDDDFDADAALIPTRVRAVHEPVPGMHGCRRSGRRATTRTCARDAGTKKAGASQRLRGVANIVVNVIVNVVDVVVDVIVVVVFTLFPCSRLWQKQTSVANKPEYSTCITLRSNHSAAVKE